MSTTLIDFKNIEKNYKSYSLKIPSLKLCKGKTYLLLGANGSGKTSFIKLCLEIIFPSKGMLSVKKTSIAFVPDQINLPTHLTIYKYLKLLCNYRDNSVDYEDRIKSLCREWDLDYNKRIGSLSKGMKQKLLIIQAIIHFPQLYIFDEPLNGLDKEAIKKFLSLIKKLRLHKKTILIISHDFKAFRLLWDYKLNFDNGKIIEKIL